MRITLPGPTTLAQRKLEPGTGSLRAKSDLCHYAHRLVVSGFSQRAVLQRVTETVDNKHDQHSHDADELH